MSSVDPANTTAAQARKTARATGAPASPASTEPPDPMARAIRKGVILMLLILPVFLLLVFRGSNLTLLYQTFTRSTLLGFVCVSALSLFRPKWCLPAFIALTGPVQVFSFRDFGSVSGMPIYLSSMAVLGLALLWLVRGPTLSKREPISVSWLLVLVTWVLAITFGTLALRQEPGLDGEPVTTKIVLIKGLVETFLVGAVAQRWIRCYGNISALIWAFALSLILALISGLTNYSMLLDRTPDADTGAFRFCVTSYGGPNFTGFILILTYPFVLWLGAKNRWLTYILCLLYIGVALISLSRSTPICILLETVFCALLYRKRFVPVMLLVSLPLFVALAMPLVPQQMKDYWQARWEATDHVGLLMGKAEKLESADVVRIDMKTLYKAEMLKRPFGGFGASGASDPENVYLDTAVQLGWGPAIWLLLMQSIIVITATRRLLHFFKGRDPLGAAIFVAALAEISYSAIVGLNLAKVTIGQASSESLVSIAANNTPGVFFALFLAICASPLPKESALSNADASKTDKVVRRRRSRDRRRTEPTAGNPEAIPGPA